MVLKTNRQRRADFSLAVAMAVAAITLSNSGVAVAALPAQEPPPDARWSITRSSETGPVMARTVGSITMDLRVVTDEYNMFTPTLELELADCGGKRWSASESASPVGATVADRATRVREIAADMFGKARQSCSVTVDQEASLLDGFEAAYARFEAIRQ